MKKDFSKNGGYTLVEMIIYVSILSFISVIVVTMLLSFAGSYRNVSALRLAENSALYGMERMTRDIMFATSVDTGNSTLGTSPGVLTIVSTMGGVSTTTRFYVDNGILKVDINGTYLGPLTSLGSTVTNLVFRRLSSGVSEAVKSDLTIRGTSGNVSKDKTYHNTIILRGSQ